MFECWHILSIEYSSPGSPEAQTARVGYSSLEEAEKVFEQLQVSYRLDAPIRIANGKMIRVTALRLHEVFKFTRQEAIDALKAGGGQLLYEAQGVDVEI